MADRYNISGVDRLLLVKRLTLERIFNKEITALFVN